MGSAKVGATLADRICPGLPSASRRCSVVNRLGDVADERGLYVHYDRLVIAAVVTSAGNPAAAIATATLAARKCARFPRSAEALRICVFYPLVREDESRVRCEQRKVSAAANYERLGACCVNCITRQRHFWYRASIPYHYAAPHRRNASGESRHILQEAKMKRLIGLSAVGILIAGCAGGMMMPGPSAVVRPNPKGNATGGSVPSRQKAAKSL